MAIAATNPCPCGSNKTFAACCSQLLAGKPAPTAEALMRSRYVAFVLGDLRYLGATAAGEAALAMARSSDDSALAARDWLGLEIHAVEAGTAMDETGTVTFTARFREQGRLIRQSERSAFRRVLGQWRYVGGEARFDTGLSAKAGQRKVGRNDPCPCGSGRKFKACCGA